MMYFKQKNYSEKNEEKTFNIFYDLKINASNAKKHSVLTQKKKKNRQTHKTGKRTGTNRNEQTDENISKQTNKSTNKHINKQTH